MTIKMNIGGIDVSVSDPVEAAALLRELQNGAQQASSQKRVNGSAGVIAVEAGNSIDTDAFKAAIKFLKIIDRSASALPTSEIMSALGINSTNAVGGTTKKVNQVLADLGYRKNRVYRNPKKPNEPRMWSSARQIKQAINDLEQSINSQN